MGLDFFFIALLCEWVLCGVQLLPCFNLGAVSEDGSSCLSSPIRSTAVQNCKMASGRLGSGHRDFPFLTIIGNATTRSRHSLSALYGIEQTRREHLAASSSEEQVGCSTLGRRTSGVIWVVMRTSPTITGCDCVSMVLSQITRKSSSRSLPVLNTPKLKPLVWKVDNYCAGFSLMLAFRMKLC